MAEPKSDGQSMRLVGQAGRHVRCASQPFSLCYQFTNQADSGQVLESKGPIQPCPPGRVHPRRGFSTVSELHVLLCSHPGQSGSALTRKGPSVASWAVCYPLWADLRYCPDFPGR